MTLYSADLFLQDLQINRLLTLTGQPGSGKTCMSFELAKYYLHRGYKLISNIDNIFQDEDIEQKLFEPDYIKHSVIIMEEAGHHLREWKYFEPLVLYKRKFDNIILLPSARIPHENLSEFVAKPLPWLQRILPISLNWWTYVCGSGDKDILGSFWFHPDNTIGVYDTHDVSFAPDQIVEAFRRQIDYENRKKGRRGNDFSSVGGNGDLDAQSALLTRQAKATREMLSLQKRKSR